MDFNFPISIDKLDFSSIALEPIYNPHFACSQMQVDEDDFYLNVIDVASYRVKNGDSVQVFAHEKADLDSIKLFLNGSVLGAVLHQRGILPFHGSCFLYEQKGILICGQSGAGKSSVTAAFCQDGAVFINDDITPVEITESETNIIPIKTRIKLWDDSIKKLEIENDNFDKIRPNLDKFYLPNTEEFQCKQALHHIVLLCKHNKEEFASDELEGMAKYNVLRQQIYRKMYLKGMPERQKTYFKQLFLLSKNVKVTRIMRPQIAAITATMEYIKQELAK
jgi:hypothetical protein|nr:hypothetical protein [uncultured Flavobacterium sp.]